MRHGLTSRASLRRWVLTLVTVLAVCGLGGNAVWTQHASGNAARRVQTSDRDALQRALGGLTEQYFNATFLAAATAAQSTRWTFGPRDDLALTHLAATSPLTSYGAALVGLDGAPVATSAAKLPPPTDAGYAPLRSQLLGGTPGLSDVMRVAGHQVVAFGVPVEKDGTVRAVLLTFADIRQWPLQGYNRQLVIGKQATPYVVDSHGVVAAAGDPTALGTVLPVPRTTHTSSARLHGHAVTLSTSSASRGWSAVTVQDAAAWSAGLDKSRQRAGIALAALLMVVLALMLWAFHRANTTQRRLAEQRLHDPLTGLGQRVIFELKLDAAFARRRRMGTPVSLLYCDLDGFKEVNDQYGHNVGDRLLEAVGTRLREAVRADDEAVRLGGDEFAVVAEGLEGEALEQLARRITEAVEQPVTIGRTVLTPRLSIGAATAADGDREMLLRAADLAMYEVKSARRAHEQGAPGPAPDAELPRPLLGDDALAKP